MTIVDKRGAGTLEELVISSLATADAVAKLLLEKRIITEEEFQQRLSAESATYQTMLLRLGLQSGG